MTTFNTGNPLGSTDVYDRYDNSENLDNFSNGPLDAYPDRFGVSRQSLQGIRNASQYQILGPYAAGMVFTSRNQVFSYLGEFYAPGPAITLPYTTTGAGAGEIANFRSVGDAVLRQDIAIGGLSLPGTPDPVEKGYWNDVLPGANIWKMRDRLLVGDAVDQNGNQFPGAGKTWVGDSAAGFMTYFDSRSQMAVYSSKGYIGGAFASRSSDNIGPAELNTIGVGSYVKNDNAVGSNKKSAWAYYGHAVQEQPNDFTACMEVDICNSQAYVAASPYLMGAPGTTAAHWIGVGGETAQAGLSSQPASLAIAIVSTAPRDALAGTGSLFGKGIVFQKDALSGCDGASGSAIAIEMARGHRVNWLTPTNGYAAHVRSDNTATETATSLVFGNNGVTFKGLKPDLLTEQNLLAVVANPNAANYLQLEAGNISAGPVIRATGGDTNVDLNLFTKGAGLIRLGYNSGSATVPANFTAQNYIAVKDLAGTTLYIPCRTTTW